MNTVIDSAVTETLLYHEQTKHHFHRYAKSLGFLDWANQPNPFRFYEGVTGSGCRCWQKTPRASTWLYTKGAATPFRILRTKTSAPFLSYRSGFRPGSPFLEAPGLCG